MCASRYQSTGAVERATAAAAGACWRTCRDRASMNGRCRCCAGNSVCFMNNRAGVLNAFVLFFFIYPIIRHSSTHNTRQSITVFFSFRSLSSFFHHFAILLHDVLQQQQSPGHLHCELHTLVTGTALLIPPYWCEKDKQRNKARKKNKQNPFSVGP